MSNNSWESITETEIETLLGSIKELQNAKGKFKESLDAIEIQRLLPPNKDILVPLTGSMYVPGQITDTQTFLIDIGTQYIVEKDAQGAVDYFKRKIKFIDAQSEKFTQMIQARVKAKQQAAAAIAAQTQAQAQALAQSSSGQQKINS